jgi:hypothetical protein
MEEILSILQVKLCNCTLKDDEVREIRDYIVKGTPLDFDKVHKYNLENSLRSHYNIRERFWELLDQAKENEQTFNRLLNIFFAIGQESFFKILDSRFYSVGKVVDYLRSFDNKEKLLIWIIKTNSDDASEIISACEELVKEDNSIISKAFLATEDAYIRLILSIIAVKMHCNLSEDVENYIKPYLEDIQNFDKHLKDKQVTLANLLYYAHSESEELKQLLVCIVNNCMNRRNVFDSLIRFATKYNNQIDCYSMVQEFKFDKRLYLLRLMSIYINEESQKTLKEIKEKINEMPEVFRESMALTNKNNKFGDVEKFMLSYFIFEHSKDSSDFEKLEKYIDQILRGFITNLKGFEVVSPSEKLKVFNYVLAGKGDANESVAKIEKGVGEGYLWVYHSIFFKLTYSLKETKEIIFRFLNLLFLVEKYDLAGQIIDKLVENSSYIDMMKELIAAGIEEEHLILTADIALNQYNFKATSKVVEYLNKLCVEENTNLINKIESLNINVKELVLEKLFKLNSEKYTPLLVKHLSDSSKVIKDKSTSLLSTYEGCKIQVLNELKNKKAAVRESAARILSNFDMRAYVLELEKYADTEKNEKIKVLLLNIINADYIDDEILQSAESLSKYCSERLEKTAYSAPTWIPVGGLPEIRYKDGKVLSKDVLSYILSKYSLENIVQRNLIAEKVIENCNKHDLELVGIEILNIWINNGADTKEKWILSFISAVAEFNIISTLKTQIDTWSKSARGAIACEAVKALALKGSNDCLIVIDNIARKFKHKQIKKAAEEAFVFAAQMLNLNEEDLADKIVPHLDFDKKGERVFDFGSRTFTVVLDLDFTLKIVDESGKIIKTLPKPNKSDDEVKAKEATEEFKNLKKQIKTIVSTQSLRLEMALSSNRLWKKKAWQELFVQNPIMHNFSLGLVWGVYDKGELKDTFRYMEDGSFNTKDEEEYELFEDALIGLVQPLELEEEELEAWKQQFEDYEIVQPFPQLQRKVYRVTAEEEAMKAIERFGGIKINGLSLVGKLTKMGWYRGSVQDAGGYYLFYKEDPKIGIGAELHFEWLSVGYEDEETTIYELIFYKANTVERGSYVYDEVTEENTIVPAKVSERFFSEILYDVDRALESKTGFVASWKLNR